MQLLSLLLLSLCLTKVALAIPASINCPVEYDGLCALLQVLRHLPNVQSVAYQVAANDGSSNEMLLSTAFATLQVSRGPVDFKTLLPEDAPLQGPSLNQSPGHILAFLSDELFPWLVLLFGRKGDSIVQMLPLPEIDAQRILRAPGEPVSIQALIDADLMAERHGQSTNACQKAQRDEEWVTLSTTVAHGEVASTDMELDTILAEIEARTPRSDQGEMSSHDAEKDEPRGAEDLVPTILALQILQGSKPCAEDYQHPSVTAENTIVFRGIEYILAGMIVCHRERPNEYAALIRPNRYIATNGELTKSSKWYLVNSAHHSFKTRKATFAELNQIYQSHILFYVTTSSLRKPEEKHTPPTEDSDSDSAWCPFGEEPIPEVVMLRLIAKGLVNYPDPPTVDLVHPFDHRSNKKIELNVTEESLAGNLRSPREKRAKTPSWGSGTISSLFKGRSSARKSLSPRNQKRSSSPGKDNESLSPRTSPRFNFSRLSPRKKYHDHSKKGFQAPDKQCSPQSLPPLDVSRIAPEREKSHDNSLYTCRTRDKTNAPLSLERRKSDGTIVRWAFDTESDDPLLKCTSIDGDKMGGWRDRKKAECLSEKSHSPCSLRVASLGDSSVENVKTPLAPRVPLKNSSNSVVMTNARGSSLEASCPFREANTKGSSVSPARKRPSDDTKSNSLRFE